MSDLTDSHKPYYQVEYRIGGEDTVATDWVHKSNVNARFGCSPARIPTSGCQSRFQGGDVLVVPDVRVSRSFRETSCLQITLLQGSKYHE